MAGTSVMTNGPQDLSGQAPKFIQQLSGINSVNEGDSVHLETAIAPVSNDKGLQIDWYKNGTLLSAGSRFNSMYDRGHITFDILYTFAEDSGEYVCVVKSLGGSAQSNPVHVDVKPEEILQQADYHDEITRTQVIDQFAAMRDDRYKQTSAPSFSTNLPSHIDVSEGDPLQLELSVGPVNDTSLTVEWYKDGKPLGTGSRFQISSDRGLCVLRIAHCIAEDSGQYTCVATNALGQASSSPLNFSCSQGELIVTKSHLPEGSAGYIRLQEMESEIADPGATDFRYQEMPEQESPPHFDVLPVNTVAGEGGPVRFLVKTSGHPQPQIQWFINDQPVTEDSLSVVHNDGAISCLEILRCNHLGENSIRIIASNKLGQIDATAAYNVVPMADFRPDLKHIAPENPYKRMTALKRVEVSSELNKQFSRSKPSAEKIIQLERESLSKLYKEDVLQTEQLYDQVSSKLRRHQPGHNQAISESASIMLN